MNNLLNSLKDLRRIKLIDEINEVKLISKKTNGKVYLVNSKYVLKIANKRLLKIENIFLDYYKKFEKCEKVIYYKEDNEYALYKFINGHELNNFDKEECYYINDILNIINNYKEIHIDGYGNLLNLKEDWITFLKDEIKAKEYEMKNEELKKKIVKESIDILKKYKFEKKFLHGDLGFYNIIYENNILTGIIDPRPIVGDPIYDYIYCMFSNVNFIKKANISKIIKLSKEPIEKIKALMYIVLYIRIAIEKKHKNIDRVKEYENIWNRIKEEEIGNL